MGESDELKIKMEFEKLKFVNLSLIKKSEEISKKKHLKSHKYLGNKLDEIIDYCKHSEEEETIYTYPKAVNSINEQLEDLNKKLSERLEKMN